MILKKSWEQGWTGMITWEKDSLGSIPFKWIMADSRFDGIPMVLETPDDSLWEEEITLSEEFCKIVFLIATIRISLIVIQNT